MHGCDVCHSGMGVVQAACTNLSHLLDGRIYARITLAPQAPQVGWSARPQLRMFVCNRYGIYVRSLPMCRQDCCLHGRGGMSSSAVACSEGRT